MSIFILCFMMAFSWGHEKTPDFKNIKFEPVQTRHKDSSCSGGCSHQKTSSDKDTQDILSLLNIFHQAIDGEHHHTHSFKEFFQTFTKKESWKTYIQNFDFKRIGVRAVRAYNIESDKQGIKNHAKNLALIYPISHAIEMMAAPVFVSMGSAGDLPAMVIAGGGFVLSLIAVPGIDPLCIAVLSLYPLKPIHKTIDFFRRGVESTTRFALRAFRVNELKSRYFTKVDQLEHVKLLFEKQGKQNVEFVQIGNKQTIQFKEPRTQEVLTKIEIQNNYVKSIALNSYAHREQNLIAEFSKSFSWSLKQAIKEAQVYTKKQKLKKLESEFYIEQIKVTNNQVLINYKPKAIPIKSISIARSNVCKRLF